MSSPVPGNILIVGATGVIGSHITSAIVNHPNLATKITIFTSPTTASLTSGLKHALLAKWKSQGVEVITGDISSTPDIQRAYEGQDTVISALGRDSLASQIELLRVAEETAQSGGAGGIKWFFPSEYGTDVEYDPVTSPHEKPHQNKLKVRRYIRENVKKVKVTYVVTGPYADMFVTLSPVEEAQANGGFDVKTKRAVVCGDGEGRIGFCSMPDVGKFVAAALSHPEQSYGKALKVQSFVTTPNAILAEFEKQTNAKWTVEKTPLDKLRELETKTWEEGKPYATGFTLRRIWAEGGTLYEKTDNEALGVKDDELETVADVVGRAVRGDGC